MQGIISNGRADDGSCEGVPRKPKPIAWKEVSLSEAMRRTLDAVGGSKMNGDISVYEGFGSFHSENVEDLINMKDADYVPPRDVPAFARAILTKEGLAQLSFLRARRDVAEVRARATPLSGFKRGRQDDEGTQTPMSNPPAAAVGFPPVGSCAQSASDGDGVGSGAHAGAGGGGDGDEAMTSVSDNGDGSMEPDDDLATVETNHEQLIERLVAQPIPVCEMGQEFRDAHFMITPEMVFINHGAFGSSLAGAVAIKRGYEELMETEVVEFVDRKLLPLIVYSIRALSRFLHADPRQVILLQNATYGMNCAMRLIEKDDVVAFLDTEYLSVYKMMWFRCQEVGATHHELSISKFLHHSSVMGDDAALAAEIVRQLPTGCTTVIVDFITSTSAICMPVFSHIIPALRAHGVKKIIVDGAHCPLQVNLDFNSLPPESQPTIFVGNLHKWFSSPKSVGFFWVRAEDADSVHSVVLSHGAGDGLLSEFIWDGTRDYGAFLSIPAIVAFWEAQGVDRVRAYCTHLLDSAVAMLTDAFRSRAVARRSPFMSLVELPEELQDDYVTVKYIQDVLHDVYHVEVPVKRVEGRNYLRISAFVYNTPGEYVYLREAVLNIADRWFHSDERRNMALAAAQEVREQQHAAVSGAAEGDSAPTAPPCDERIRRQGGCGVSGLDPSLKRKKTRKF